MTRDEIAARQEKRTERDGWRSPIVEGYYQDVAWLLERADALAKQLDILCRPITGELELFAAAAGDGLRCEATLGIENMKSQLAAIQRGCIDEAQKARAVLATYRGPAGGALHE